jgi:ribonuclease P protein component
VIAAKPLTEVKKTAVFTKEHRLLLPSQFQQVFKQGTWIKGSFFVFVFFENESTYARLGLAIAKRHIPLAVSRNQIKRIIRESFRLQQSLLSGKDVVVMVKGKIQKESRAALHEELSTRWQLIANYRRKSY